MDGGRPGLKRDQTRRQVQAVGERLEVRSVGWEWVMVLDGLEAEQRCHPARPDARQGAEHVLKVTSVRGGDVQE
jgi:hypothetical protein